MFILILGIIKTLALDVLSDSNCIEAQVSEQQKLFDPRSYFVGINNLEELTNDNKMKLDYNIIEIESNFTLLPQEVELKSLIYIEFIESETDEICSLFFNHTIQTYFIECIDWFKEQNKVGVNKNQIRVPTSLDSQCQQLSFEQQYFLILCEQSQDYQIIKIEKKSGFIQVHELNLTKDQLNQCSIKYQMNEQELLIGLFCCDDWEIFSLNQEGQKQLILFYEHPIFQNEFEIFEKQLLNVQFVQQEIHLMFTNGKYKLLFLQKQATCIFYGQEVYSKQDICTDQINKFSDFNIISNVLQFKKQFIQQNLPQIYYFKDFQFLLVYQTNIEFIQSTLYNQSVSVVLQKVLIPNKRMRYIFGVDKSNVLIQFKITALHQYYPYKQNYLHKYVIQYGQKMFNDAIEIQNCYKIYPFKEEEQNFQLQIMEEQNQIFYTQNDPTKLEIKFARKDIILNNVPYNISTNEGIISNLINLENFCNYTQYFPSAKGYFFVQDHYLYKLIAFEGENNTLVVFNCEKNTFRVHHINFQGNSESVYFNDILYILDKSGTYLYGLDVRDTNDIQLLEYFNNQMIFFSQEKTRYKNSIYLQKKQMNDEITVGHFIQDLVPYRYNEITLSIKQKQFKQFEKIIMIDIDVYFIQTVENIILMVNFEVYQVLHENLHLIDANCHFNNLNYVCVIVGINQNQMKKYMISQNEQTLLSMFIFESYEPVYPAQFVTFRIEQDHMILIATRQKSNNQQYLLLLNHKFNDQIFLDLIIQCGNFFFELNQNSVYFYDINMQLMILDYNYFRITIKDREQKQYIENITLSFQFIPLLGNISTKINKNISFNLLRDSNLLQTKNQETDLILSNNSLLLNIRDYFIGNVENISNEGASEFTIQPPLKELYRIYCEQSINNYCVNIKSPYLSFLNVLTSQTLNYKIENQTEYFLFYFNQIMKKDSYIVIFSDKLSKFVLKILKTKNDQLEDSPYSLKLNNYILRLFLVQNILLIVQNNKTTIYEVTEEKLFQLQILNSQCSQFSFAQNIYIISILQFESLTLQLFKVEQSSFMDLQTFEITSKIIQNQVKKKFQYHLKILFLKIKIDNIRIDSEIIYMDIFIQDKTRYIFWVNVVLHLSNATYEIMVKNFFDNMQFNVQQHSVMQVQENFLVVTAPKVRVFQLAVGQEHIQPIYQRSESYSDSFNMNTTHLVFSKEVDYKNYFAIFSIQQWELILTDRLEKREIYEVKIQAQNKLFQSSQITLKITLEKGIKPVQFFYIILIFSNLLLIFVLVQKGSAFKTKRKQKNAIMVNES